jgi:hypothetical protein
VGTIAREEKEIHIETQKNRKHNGKNRGNVKIVCIK